MRSQDVVNWTAILGGCAMHGYGTEALKHFEQMCEGVELDDIIFTYLLLTCSHVGLVDEGMQEAKIMVMAMPYKPHVAPWRVLLLSACKIHGNVEMVECVAKQILEMELDNVASYVLLSQIYAIVGNRHLCEIVEWQRKEKGCEEVARLHLD